MAPTDEQIREFLTSMTDAFSAEYELRAAVLDARDDLLERQRDSMTPEQIEAVELELVDGWEALDKAVAEFGAFLDSIGVPR